MASDTGIKLFRKFDLLTEAHPIIAGLGDGEPGIEPWDENAGFRATIGPNVDKEGMSQAIRTLVPEEFGNFWDVNHTTTPYR